jgi:hypothetical protein
LVKICPNLIKNILWTKKVQRSFQQNTIRLWLGALTERSEMRKIMLKAYLVVWEGNLAYLVFCSLLQKTNVLNYEIEKTALSKAVVLINLLDFHTQVYRF